MIDIPFLRGKKWEEQSGDQSQASLKFNKINPLGFKA